MSWAAMRQLAAARAAARSLSTPPSTPCCSSSSLTFTGRPTASRDRETPLRRRRQPNVRNVSKGLRRNTPTPPLQRRSKVTARTRARLHNAATGAPPARGRLTWPRQARAWAAHSGAATLQRPGSHVSESCYGERALERHGVGAASAVIRFQVALANRTWFAARGLPACRAVSAVMQ